MSRRPPILMLHHVEPGPLDPAPHHPNSYLSIEEFAAFLDQIRTAGLATATLGDAVAGRAPRSTVVLTFDDGCRCFAEHAAPELLARGMTATLFAVAGALGGTNRWDERDGERTEHLLDAEALCALAAQGFEIGAHGFHHRDLSACSDDELAEETATAKATLEAALARPVSTFCYPYGHLSPAARAAVGAAGFRAAVSIHGAPHADARDPLALPRLIVNPSESRFERRLKLAGLYPLYSKLPRLGLLRWLRAPRARRAA